MEAGKLRHRITIEQPDGTRSSGAGEPQPNWTEFAQVWASVEPLSGREGLQGKQFGSELSHRVRIRFIPALSSTMRIVYGDITLSIDSIVNVSLRNAEMELLCTQRTTD